MTNSLLITGGAGFIGSMFVRIALDSDYEAIVLDKLTYAGNRSNLDECIATRKCALVVGDICDGTLVLDMLHHYQPVAVINFAAETHVDNSIVRHEPFLKTNVIGTSQLLNAALSYFRAATPTQAAAFRFVQISTDEVFGSLSKEGKFTETSAYDPRSPYSASKASADHLVRAWFTTYGLPVIITYCSNNYGPRQFHEKLIPHVIRCALRGETIPVYGDGLNVRDWIHVEDHCRGILMALEHGHPGESYCIGGENEWTNIDLVRKICQLIDLNAHRPGGGSYCDQIAFVADRLGHDRRYGIDPTKARAELGYKVTRNFEKSLADTVLWYLENRSWLER